MFFKYNMIRTSILVISLILKLRLRQVILPENLKNKEVISIWS